LLCFNREDKLFATFCTNQHSALKAVDHNNPPLLCSRTDVRAGRTQKSQLFLDGLVCG
jgi:hypothetical protein